MQQCHRITDTINNALEDQQYCSAVFLDVSQAFDKVWHPGLLLKIKITLPPGYYNLLKSYLQDRYFMTKFNDETSPRFPIHSGVPQGSILGPLLYTLYASDFPASRKTTLSTLRMIELYLRLIQILRQPPSISRTLYIASKNGSSYGK